MPEDSDLLGQLRNGDGEALRTLYDRYKHDLLTVAAFLLGDVYGVSGAQPVDVLRRALSRAVEAPEATPPEGATCGPDGCG